GGQPASVTPAAGLSSAGAAALDAALPHDERFDIPEDTARAVAEAERVVAVGTSVVRALEGSAVLGVRSGETDLILGPGYAPRVVDGLLTGVHEEGASHYALLRAFGSAELLACDTDHAETAG